MPESEKMTGKSLLARDTVELQSLLVEKREDLRKLRFKHARRELGPTHTLANLRRDVARLCGALSSKAKRAGQEKG
jgi:ribosomal protein L29